MLFLYNLFLLLLPGVELLFISLNRKLNKGSFDMNKNTFYNIQFFQGSGIPYEFYVPFLKELQGSHDSLNILERSSCFSVCSYPKNTVLIGHSFGGSMSLYHYLFEKSLGKNNIKACVLINSHFNHNNVMPYPSINLNKITIPVYVILTEHDEKLPLFKALDDNNYIKEKNISNIHFHVIPGSHTSIFETRSNIIQTTRSIKNFISYQKVI